MIRILLSAGHGAGQAHNRGSVCSNEGDNNFYYSLELKRELEKYDGVKVDLIRNKITDNPSVTNRSKMGKGYDLYFSIHSNASNPSVRGTEVFDSVERPNYKLAKAICDTTAKYFNHNNRGVKYRERQSGFNYYGELRFNEAKSAMLVENGFHTNSMDCLIFKKNHKDLAKLQAKEIANFYELRLKSDKKPIDVTKPSVWAVEDWEFGVKLGLTDGTNPRNKASREMVIAVLDRYMKLCKDKGLSSKSLKLQNPIVKYTDSPSNWAKKDWEWGISAKITAGTDPKNEITREELIAMIVRHYKAIGGR